MVKIIYLIIFTIVRLVRSSSIPISLSQSSISSTLKEIVSSVVSGAVTCESPFPELNNEIDKLLVSLSLAYYKLN